MITNIQILRFAAALLVVLHHAQPPLVNGSHFPALGATLSGLAAFGFFGVDVFFVISGAIMAHSTHHIRNGVANAIRFTVTRFARIYAGWWPFFGVYLLLTVWQDKLADIALWRSFWLLKLGLQQMLLPLTWTLSFEIFFYAVLGVILMFPKRWTSWLMLLWAAITLVAVLHYYAIGMYTVARFPWTTTFHQLFFFPLVLEFIAGFLLYKFLQARPATPPVLWAAVVGIGGYLSVRVHTGSNLLHPSGLAGYFYGLERAVFLGAAACGLVALALQLPQAAGAWGRIGVSLGNASYSMYLGHIAVLVVLREWLPKSPHTDDLRTLVYLGLFVAVVAYALAHYRWIERPLYRLMRHWLSKLPGAARYDARWQSP